MTTTTPTPPQPPKPEPSWWWAANIAALILFPTGIILMIAGVELPKAMGPGCLVFFAFWLKSQADLVAERSMSQGWRKAVKLLEPLASRRSGEEERGDILLAIEALGAEAMSLPNEEARAARIAALTRIGRVVAMGRHEGLVRKRMEFERAERAKSAN